MTWQNILKGLSPKQKKLDRNNNGEIDGEDFAMLRGDSELKASMGGTKKSVKNYALNVLRSKFNSIGKESTHKKGDTMQLGRLNFKITDWRMGEDSILNASGIIKFSTDKIGRWSVEDLNGLNFHVEVTGNESAIRQFYERTRSR